MEIPMKKICPLIVLFTMLLLSPSVDAGDWLHGHRHGDTHCDCHADRGTNTDYFHPAINPAVDAAWGYTSAASACCGGSMGISHFGSSPTFHSGYAQSGTFSHGHLWPLRHHGSFLSGFEGIPSMDGGGIHHRLPYHSYRRPWAHPGTPSTNVTIVW
jgi:hypothetical protein